MITNNSGSLMVLAQRGWQAISGVVTLAFVAHYLTPIEQGYFYTLASIAALYMVLDMGLSTVLVQFAAREFIGLSWGGDGRIEGAEPLRFLALIRLSLKWYGIAAAIFLLSYPAGVLFMSQGQAEPGYDWRTPWALLVLATSAGLAFLPVLAFVEGSGNIAEAYAVRLAQGVLGAVAAWLVLGLGGGLYAVAAMPTASALVAGSWIVLRRPGMVGQAFRANAVTFRWGAEVWPLQWRIGASWLAGYVLVLMHVPLLFRTQGAVVAGQMGVTMTVVNMLSILAMSWMTARIPEMTRFITQREWGSLDKVYWRAFQWSGLFFVAGSLLFFLMRLVLDSTPYGARFLPLAESAGLLFSMGFYHVSGLLAAYLRAHLKEPFLWTSLAGALITATVVIWAAPLWGAAGIVTALATINALFFFPVSLWLWVTLRREWHGDAA